MADIVQTPTLGLNKPPKGYFDWDVPLNENWDKLDVLGAGQLPLLSTIWVDHKLEGAEATGWALQGSVLDGEIYTSAWDKLKEAQGRATSQSIDVYGTQYTFKRDPQTGWCFVTQAEYDKAYSGWADSLGFVLDETAGKKLFTLPKRENFLKASSAGGSIFGAETLPDPKGEVYAYDFQGQYSQANKFGSLSVANVNKAQGRAISGGTSASGTTQALIKFSANSATPVYQDGAAVRPTHSTCLVYYKVGNTVVSKDQIDVGNLLTKVAGLETNKLDKNFSNAEANFDYVIEGGNNFMKFRSGKLIQWGYEPSRTANKITMPRPFATTDWRINLTLVMNAGGGGSGTPQIVQAGAKTTNTVQVDLPSSTGNYLGAEWIAIGKGA